MKKIMFNTKLGLEQAVLEGRKTQTRRLLTLTLHKKADRGNALIEVSPSKVFFEDGKWKFVYDDYIFLLPKKNYPKYEVGAVVAVAQSYRDCGGLNEAGVPRWDVISQTVGSTNAGWDNKMFVKPELMPHQIRITNVRIEHLQDINDEDCMKEGIEFDGKARQFYCGFNKSKNSKIWLGGTPREAYASLIDKVGKKGDWDKNPYVFVYDFELVK